MHVHRDQLVVTVLEFVITTNKLSFTEKLRDHPIDLVLSPYMVSV
jgi:hypothetical protein